MTRAELALAEISKFHQPSTMTELDAVGWPNAITNCAECGKPWPCRTRVVLAVIAPSEDE